MNHHPVRITVFASGSGSNAENIVAYFRANQCGVEVPLIVCNKADAYVLKRAERLGVDAVIVGREEFRNSEVVMPLLESYGITHIVLAGFLLMVPQYLLEAFPDRIVNIHPSLLPKFGGKGMYGMHIHRAVVEAGEKETGITIHLVNEHCDEGRILFQTSVEVLPEDTPDTVAEKIHILEQRHFPEVIRSVFA